ncbi:MAG: HD-GYP domain-containing protein [Nitrospirae bacterium]|nr:HD-GYP domain-containing protein [Nitrospirota bacterium]
MVKKIKIEQLKPNMYICDFDCGWMQHPFLSNNVKVEDEKIIEKIRRVGIREVYIDTEQGLDVADAPTKEEVKKRIQTEIQEVADVPLMVKDRISVREEIDNAREIKKEAKQVVHNIMEDARLGKQVDVEKVNHIVGKMAGSIFRNKDALLLLGRMKKTDEYTFLHSLNVCVLMLSFGRYLGLDQQVIHEIGVGGMLHDIGKMKVPIEILTKRGQLTNEEYEEIKKHVEHGRLLLEKSPGIANISVLVTAQHHERADGSGYPNGLKGDDISRYGQMASIADVYDAITSNRCYKNAMEPTGALSKLYEWSDFHFNRDLVQHFIRCVGIYPIGALVRLESGLLGVVIAHGDKPVNPVLRIVYNTKKECFIMPFVCDISHQGNGDKPDRIVAYELPKNWNITPQNYLN